MFKNAKVGDKVWDLQYGWGTIIELSKTHNYGLVANFININNESETCTYTIEGKSAKLHILPTLFWNEFKIPPEAFIKPQPKLEKDTKVLVWNEKGCFNDSTKHKRYFSHFTKDGRICCYEQGCTSWSSNNTQVWDNWELYEK